MSAGSILVIDDDPDVRATLREILELDGYRVATAGSVSEALDRGGWEQLLAILLDRKLPDGTSETLLPRLRELAPAAAVVIVTGYADLDGAVSALRAGATDYLVKPLRTEVLRATLARIAERHRLEADRQRSETAFRSLVETAQCMILILKPGRRIAYFSPFAESLSGYTAAEVEGQDYARLFVPPEHRHEVERRIDWAMTGRAGEVFESRVRCRNRAGRWMVFNARRLAGEHEGPPSLLLVGQDVTNFKEAQELLLQSERLAAIGQMVAGLAHESRNALQRGQACLGMLAKRLKGQSEVEELLLGVQQAQQDLYHLYEEVRAYAAPIRLRCEACDLMQILDEAWTQIGALRQGRDVRLRQTGGDLDACCDVDPFAVGQAFRNILENSLTACPDPVHLEVAWEADDIEGAAAVRVAIADNGPGLSAEQQERVFEPFYTTKTHGTGLGMPITRRIVEAHNGRIWVDKTSQGARFVMQWRRRG